MKEDDFSLSYNYFKYIKDKTQGFIQQKKYKNIAEKEIKDILDELSLLEKDFYQPVKSFFGRSEYIKEYNNLIKETESKTKRIENLAMNLDYVLRIADDYYDNMSQSEKYLLYLLDQTNDVIRDEDLVEIKPDVEKILNELEECWKNSQWTKNIKENREVDPYGEENWIEELIDVQKLEEISKRLNSLIKKHSFK
jgi:hypothetical protein